MNEDPQPIQEIQEPTFEVLAPEPAQPPVKLRHALSLANLWHVWIGLRNSAPRTIEVHQHIARRFCHFFGLSADRIRPHRLDKQGMLEWMRHLQNIRTPTKFPKPLGAVRINKINSVVKAFLKWMRQMDYIHEDLAGCIPTLMTPGPKESVIITEEEYDRIKKWCAGKPHYQATLWLCILAYRTGMSMIDCCHLRWKDVHLNENGHSFLEIHRIKIRRFGDKAKCQIPIVPMSDVHLWLLNLKNAPQWKMPDGVTDYVHPEAVALYRAPIHSVDRDVKQIFYRTKINPPNGKGGKTFKCFRNSMCSNLVNSGMQLALVCTITGHNSVKTLLRYLKPDRRSLQDGLAVAQQFSAIKNGVSDGSDGMQPSDSAFL